MASSRRPATEAEAKALASGLRLRILRACLDQPLTNREIAERLDLNPGTALHHVRQLVATGFLDPQPARRGRRGAREVPYLATGKSWTLDVREEQDRFGAPVTFMIEAFLAEVAQVPDRSDIVASRLGLRLTEAEYEQLMAQLAEWLEQLASQPRRPEGRPYSMFVAIHPDAGRQ